MGILSRDVRTDLNFAYTGFKNLRLLANINNVFDQPRPIKVRDGYVLRPRALKLGAEYTFQLDSRDRASKGCPADLA